MKKYAEFMISRCGKNGLLSKNLHLKGEAKKYAVNAGQSYGEWAEPADVHPNNWKDMVAPHPEVSTAYTAYVLGLMAKIAKRMGRTDDETRYKTYSEGCRRAFRDGDGSLARCPGNVRGRGAVGQDKAATVVDDGVVCRPAFLDIHPAAVIDGSAVRRAAFGDEQTTGGNEGAVRRAAVVDSQVT